MRPEQKGNAPGEARTHGLQIMRLTRCLLRYGGDTFSWADHCYRPGGENRSGVGQNHILSLEKDLTHASAGNFFYIYLQNLPKQNIYRTYKNKIFTELTKPKIDFFAKNKTK